LRKRTVVLLILGLFVAILALIALGWFPQEILRSTLEARLRQALGRVEHAARMGDCPPAQDADVPVRR